MSISLNVLKNKTEYKFLCNSVQALRLTDQQLEQQTGESCDFQTLLCLRPQPRGKKQKAALSPSLPVPFLMAAALPSQHASPQRPIRKAGEGKRVVRRADIF